MRSNLLQTVVFGCMLSVSPTVGFTQAADVDCDKCVDTRDIATGAVGNARIADGAVNGFKVKNKSLTGDDLADRTIGSAHIKDDAIRSGKIANDAVFGRHITDGSIGTEDLADGAVGIDDMSASSLPIVALKTKTTETHFNFSNGCREYLSVVIDAPVPGIVLVDADVVAFFRQTSASDTELRAYVDTSINCDSTSGLSEGSAASWIVPPQNQSGELRYPVHTQRTFVVGPGTTRYYINGFRSISDTTTAGFERGSIRAVFYPGATLQIQ